MLIQKLPNEVVDNDLIGTDLDTLIFKINVPASWSGKLHFSVRYQGYNTAYVESIGESALLIDSQSATATDKFVFTYQSPEHQIYFTTGEHYIKVYKLSGFNGIRFDDIKLPMHVVFGNPKYIYRTCSSWAGIGNMLVNNLPFDAAQYKMNDLGHNPGLIGTDVQIHYAKCSDIGAIVNQLTGGDTDAFYFTNGSDMTGDIACFDGRNTRKMYCANTKIYGDIIHFGTMTNLSGDTTADPAIYAQNCGVYGTVESLAEALFNNGKTSGTIMCQFGGSKVTYNSEAVGNVLIAFTDEGYTITLP